jgi:hypothetical protein
MNLIENFLDGNEQRLYELCQKYFNLKNEYTEIGLQPPPKEMALKLMLTIEEYSELTQWIEGGGYEDLIRDRIANDFQNGAETMPDNLQP